MSNQASSNAVVPNTPSTHMGTNSNEVPNSSVQEISNPYHPAPIPVISVSSQSHPQPILSSYPHVSNSSEEEPFEEPGYASHPINLTSSSVSGNDSVSIPVHRSPSPAVPYQRRTAEGARLPYAPRDPYAPGPSAPAQVNCGFGPSFFQGDPYAAGPSRTAAYYPSISRAIPATEAADRSEYTLRQMSRMSNSLFNAREAIDNQAQALTGAYQQASEAMTVAREGKKTIGKVMWMLSVLVVLVIALITIVFIKM